MHHHNFTALWLALLALSTGCDGSSGSGTNSASASELGTYQALAAKVQSAALAYRATMSGSGVTTVQSCQEVQVGYDSQVRGWVSQMSQMAGAMDSFIDSHGGAMVADMQCVSGTMLDELDRHKSTACASPDLQMDRAEALRHADAMSSLTGHSSSRCDEARGALDGGTARWSPMLQGCEGWDGRCSAMMHDHCCGAMHSGCL